MSLVGRVSCRVMCLVPNIVGGLCCATRRVNSCSDEDCLSTLPALLRLGADLEAKDRNGKTPLFQCKDNETALQLLLAAGANVDIIYSQKPRSIGTCFSSLRSSFVSLFFDRVGTGTEESNKKKKKRNKEQEARKGKKSALAFIAQFFSEYVIPLCFLLCNTSASHLFLCQQQQSNCGSCGILCLVESGPRVLPHSRWVVECGRHAPPCACPRVTFHSPSTDCSLTCLTRHKETAP